MKFIARAVPPITFDRSASGNSMTTNTANGAITLVAGDTVLLFVHSGLGGGSSPPVVTGPGAQTWEPLGQQPPSGQPVVSFAAGGYLFVNRSANAASGNISVQRTGGTYISFLAMVFKNVGLVTGEDIAQVFATADPAIAPTETTHFNVTVPDSVGLTVFNMNYGSNAGVVFPNTTALYQAGGQTFAAFAKPFPSPGQQQFSQPWSVTTPPADYRSMSVLLVPQAPPPDFTLSADQANIAVDQGDSNSLFISINPVGGFADPVNLSIAGLPSGVTASWSSNPANIGSTLTLTASSGAAALTTSLTITGTSGSLTDSIQVWLTVNQVTPPEPLDPRLLRLATGLLLLKIPVEVPPQ